MRARAGLGGVLAANVVWAFGPILAASIETSGLTAAFWRLWLGAALLATAALATGALRRLRGASLGQAVLGGICFGANLATFFSALQHTTVAVVAVIGALHPVLTLPAAVRWLGERVTTTAVVCSALAVGGTVLVVAAPGGDEQTLLGAVLSVLSLVAWSAFFLVSKSARASLGSLDYLAVVTVVAAVTITPLALAVSDDLGGLRGTDWLWLVLLTLGPGCLGHGLMIWAHRHVDVTVSSVLTLGEPVIATALAAVLLDQELTAAAVVGGATVLGALVILTLRTRPGPVEPPELVAPEVVAPAPGSSGGAG